MANLTFIEKTNIEIFLGMRTGYVMDFSDRTFQEFVGEAVGLDINDSKYHYRSNSKANRLRQFIKVESDYTVGKLLTSFCHYWFSKVQSGQIDFMSDEDLYKECVRIADRLKQESIVQHIDAIKPNTDDRDFKLLARSIRESIEKNEPEGALDRLHTFSFKYLRELCDKRGITYDKADSLNAVFGKYIKFLVDNHHVESAMSEKILKYSINIIEAFNDIRNNRSFAHDNPVLNYHESVLIFNNISSTIKFIEIIEEKMTKMEETEGTRDDWHDLPF
jgi:hypothetical protein